MESGTVVPSFSSVDAEETSGEDGCDVTLTKGQSSLDGDRGSAAQPQRRRGRQGSWRTGAGSHFESVGVPP